VRPGARVMVGRAPLPPPPPGEVGAAAGLAGGGVAGLAGGAVAENGLVIGAQLGADAGEDHGHGQGLGGRGRGRHGACAYTSPR
jgi:hypothetical protein